MKKREIHYLNHDYESIINSGYSLEIRMSQKKENKNKHKSPTVANLYLVKNKVRVHREVFPTNGASKLKLLNRMAVARANGALGIALRATAAWLTNPNTEPVKTSTSQQDIKEQLQATTSRLVCAGRTLTIADIAQLEEITVEDAKHKYRNFMPEIHRRQNEDFDHRYSEHAWHYFELAIGSVARLLSERPDGMSERRARAVLKNLGISSRSLKMQKTLTNLLDIKILHPKKIYKVSMTEESIRVTN